MTTGPSFIVISEAFAVPNTQEYTRRKLPDGSSEVVLPQSDGTTVKQTYYTDGRIVTQNIQRNGEQTVTTQYPDGTLDIKPKP